MGKVNGKYGRRFKLRYMLVKRNKKQEWSNMDKKELYEQALMLWGEKLQVGMAIEECSELIVELSKYLRFGLSSAHYGVIEEIADVEIMIEQLKHIFDCDECGHVEFDEREPEDCDLNCIIQGCYGTMEVVGHKYTLGAKYGD
jgi:hypothetical protein